MARRWSRCDSNAARDSAALLPWTCCRESWRHAGQWGSSVAGYVYAGETYHDAAQRRVPDELGISPALTFIGTTSMNDEQSTKFIGVFRGTADYAHIALPDHIGALEYVSIDRISEFQHTNTRTFTPTFLHVLRFCQHRMP